MNGRGKLRLAVVGGGIMGRQHARDVSELSQTELAAVCDVDRSVADELASRYQADAFYDYGDMLNGTDLDGVIIATPHYDHKPMSILAFQNGLHVLVEKPIAVHVQDAQQMIDAYEAAKALRSDLVFGTIFMQRTYGQYRKIKDLIDSGELGKLVRATWIITDWFRTQHYYDSGGWRATWAGEGGGVLMNQSPHNLDLFQWFFGLPDRVTGFAAIGKYHDIEVEDEVSAFLDYDQGMVGHFITSTAESPGTNRLEVVGENGRLVFEDGRLLFDRNQQSMFSFIAESESSFDKVESRQIEVPYVHHGQPGHRLIIENFARAILHGEALIAPAVEGIHSLMLANAIMLSAFTAQTVSLPIDEAAYARHLERLRSGAS